MFLTELLVAFIVALGISLVFIPLLGLRRGAGGSSMVAGILFFFVIVMFASWAGGVWITPVGPPLWGIHWLPFVFVGVVVALLLLAAAEPWHGRTSSGRPAPPPEGDQVAAATITAFGALFWVLMIALVVALVSRYFLVD